MNLNPYIYFSIAGFIYLIILSFVYFGKERIITFETKIYSSILVIGLLCFVFELISAFIISSAFLMIKIFF